MNHPRFLNRVLGSLPAVALLLLVAGGLAYDWWTHQDTASGWLPVVALVLVGTAMSARKEVTSYRNWKRSWDAMEGRPPPSGRHGLKAIGFLIVAVGVGDIVFAQLMRTPPVVDELGTGVLVVTTLGFAYQMRQRRCELGPRTKKGRKVKPAAPHIAQLCLPVPKPEKPPVLAALPMYCQALLRRQYGAYGR